MNPSRRLWPSALLCMSIATCSIGHAVAQPAGGPPIDPRAMSGIPRADAQTEPGTVVVRCLLGAFNRPAAGVTVELELKSADGSKVETRQVVAGADGRASFADLSAYFGGVAIASTEFEGQRVRSQPISLTEVDGFRVLLVQGAGEAGPEASPDPAGHAGDVPMPGVAFANPGTPRGTVLIGTLDLGAGAPIPGAKVRLILTGPDLVETRDAVSDERGTVRFPGLDALGPDVTLVAEADLPTGTERSQPFSVAGKDTGMAVVLAVVGPRQPERRQLMTGARALPTLAPGTVRVTVFGPDDRPVAEVPITVIKQDVTGLKQRFDEVTGDDGVARLVDIPVTNEGLFRVEAIHAGAPWRSTYFTLDERMGVALEMRVYPVTSDLTKVRSAVQFGVESLENDFARVDHLYQVYVDGDAAYWPGRPYKLLPADGATGMILRERADNALEQTKDAPFATIEAPLPPGELIDLSTAYLLEHAGTADLRWTAPFPILDARVVVVDGLRLSRGAKKPPMRPPHREGEVRADLDIYELGAMPQGQAFDLEIDGLITRSRLYKHLGLGLGLAVAFACGLAFALRPRASLRERLERRKSVLLRKLDAARSESERAAIVAALDQVFCQLDALGVGPRHADLGAAWSQDKA